jgi:hypothetical protein
VPGNSFAYQAGEARVDVVSGADLGGLTWLGINPDGSFVLLLDEVYARDVFEVRESTHLFDGDGSPLGTGSFPLGDQHVEVLHALVLGPDGYVYGLLAGPDDVAVARLPYNASDSGES